MNIHSPYKVISQSPEDGILVDHFESREEAEDFAREMAEEGYTTVVCQKTRVFESERRPIDFGVRSGVDYPATLGPCLDTNVWMPRSAA